MTDDLINTADAAVYLNVGFAALSESRQTECLQGRRPPTHRKKGRFVFYREQDLDAWLENKESATQYSVNYMRGK